MLEAVQTAKQQRTLAVIAIDMPSGMDADTGACDPACCPADLTVTLAFPKPGLYGLPGADYTGRIIIADIGIPAELAASSQTELIDTALDPETVETIRDEIFSVDGVRALHMLRSRSSGGQAFVDVHIQVDPRVSVSEGHQIGDSVRRRLLERIEEVSDVMVHIDPEDDELESPCDHLPLRSDLVQSLNRQWAHLEGVDASRVTLHYQRGELQVDVLLPYAVVERYSDPKVLIRQIQKAATELPEVAAVRVSFHHGMHQTSAS